MMMVLKGKRRKIEKDDNGHDDGDDDIYMDEKQDDCLTNS